MKRISQTIAGVTLGVALGFTAAMVAHRTFAADATPLPAPKFVVSDTPVERESHVTSFSPVIKKASPSVVNVYSSKTIRPFWGEDSDESHGRHHGPYQSIGLGSGVIVSSDGYILTASHVVQDADEVKISLADGEKELNVKVVGSDPGTDVAVLKVDAKDLPAITLTDSDKLEVGDVVLAIGNPFEVGKTVTMGIVSGLGRHKMGINEYENFIQTDAAINMGNSGGALIDAEGRLIGINTAILSGSGGNQGIGFAVPINLARFIMERIIKDGKVSRGYLGVSIDSLTPDLAKEYKVPIENGALIQRVLPATPAAKAGLQKGDVIAELNGQKVTDGDEFHLAVSELLPESQATLKVLRGSTEKTVNVVLAQLPNRTVAEDDDAADTGGNPLDGLTMSDLTAKLRQDFSVPQRVQGGAIVTKVAPGSAAQKMGLKAGDVITGVNHQPVSSPAELAKAVHEASGGRVVLSVRTHDEDGNPMRRYLVVPDEPITK